MGILIKNNIVNQKGTPAFYESSLATRPIANIQGRMFIDTDVPSTGIYRDNGTSWNQVADPGAGTTGTLQQVTTNGSSTNVGINITSGGLNSNFVNIATNALGSSTNYIGQTYAINDNWKIFGTGSTIDQGEMVFQVGDNGTSYASGNGERFRFSYDPTGGTGTARDSFIIDYDTIYVNASLGINTPTPSASLDVHSTVNVIAQLNQLTATNNSLLSFQNNSVGLWRIGNFYNSASNDFSIYNVTSASNFITIKNNGNFLLGTTTDSGYKLSVSGTANITGSVLFNSTITATQGFFNGIATNGTPSTQGTSQTFLQYRNTGGDLYIGREGSTSGGFFTGSTAYADIWYSTNPMQVIINSVKRFQISTTGIINLSNVPVYATNALALAGGLVVGDIYKNSVGVLSIVY
jgi:hypothetical protein